MDEINNIIGTWGKFGREQEIINLQLNQNKNNEELSKFLGLKNIDLD